MVRTQVQLREQQLKVLRARAARDKVSVSELVRRAVDLLTRIESMTSPEELRRRDGDVAEGSASGRSDGAERPDDDLARPLEARIDQLYDEIRDLVAGSIEDPGLEGEIERKREQLQVLQTEEASAWRHRADARRHLKPGEGYRLLERATTLLDL